MAKIVHKVKKHFSELQREIANQMLTLATSAFGLIAALAWNELTKEVIVKLIKPILGENSGMVSLFIYAVLVTVLAVATTYFLTKLIKK